MNTFILDRHTDPQNPTVTSVQNDRIPVYDTVADAEADLANLEVGQIVATKEVEKSLFDYIYPIGSTYTQYPDCASPNELWPDTTWTELDFNGAFFRATGGLAQAFDNQTSMQGQGTAKNGLYLTGMSNGSKISGSTSMVDRTAGHSHVMNGRARYGNDSYGYFSSVSGGPSANIDTNSNYDKIYLFSDDNETRPMNYTFKIWKRTA